MDNKNTLKKEHKSLSVKDVFSNKSGFSNIQWALMILILVIILIFIVYYAAAVSNAAAQKQKAKNALDEYLQTNAIRIYSEVKQGKDYTEELYVEEYIDYLVRADNLTRENDRLVSYSASGTTRYYMTIPQMEFIEDFTPKITAKYTISLPVTFAGARVVWVDIPMTVESRFVPKFDQDSANGSGGSGNNTQVKKHGAFAVYYAASQTLKFYKNYDYNTVSVGNTYGGGTVTAVFTGFEDGQYTWGAFAQNIKRVEFVDEIKPTSTSNWFAGFSNCVELNLMNLNTRETTSMDNMFDGMTKLEKVIVGSNFSFSPKGSSTYKAILPTPDPTFIAGADGYWYTNSGAKYTPTTIPNKAEGIYYAFDSQNDTPNPSITHD